MVDLKGLYEGKYNDTKCALCRSALEDIHHLFEWVALDNRKKIEIYDILYDKETENIKHATLEIQKKLEERTWKIEVEEETICSETAASCLIDHPEIGRGISHK